MPQPLLKTKLHVPRPRPERVPRPRLIERLTQGLTSPLTVISAPAGFGKTTPVGEWRASPAGQDAPLAWLSLDEDDNDLVRFMTYLIAALEGIQAGLGSDALALLQAGSTLTAKPILTALVNALSDRDTEAVLVLDDYHLITSASVHEALAFLLDHMPPLLHLILLSRIDPPLPLARWRVRGQLTEIRAADLRFTPEEADAFLRQTMRLHLAAGDVAALEERTEGWIAGLQLAALAIQGRAADRAFHATRIIEGFSGRQHFMLDYMTDKVLSRQPESVQRFLLQTSILERMCGPLCDAVTCLHTPPRSGEEPGVGSGQAMLEQLEHANLFVIPLDDECNWYRYHHLFRDLLRTRLTESQIDLPALHRRASAWYAQNALMVEAIRHALAAQDVDAAADLIERIVPEAALWASGDMVMLRDWMKVLPAEMIHARPRLGLYVSWTQYLTGNLSAAERTLDKAEQSLSQMPVQADRDELIGVVASTRARYAWVRGQPHAALDFVRTAYAHLPARALFFRARTAYAEGGAQTDLGHTREAAQAFQRSFEMAEAMGASYLAVGAAGELL